MADQEQKLAKVDQETGVRTYPFLSPGILLVGGAALIAVACTGSPDAPSRVVSPPSATVGTGELGQGESRSEATAANTTAVCHITGNGTYHLLKINPNALQAHLQHGDVLPTNDACPGPVTDTARR